MIHSLLYWKKSGFTSENRIFLSISVNDDAVFVKVDQSLFNLILYDFAGGSTHRLTDKMIRTAGSDFTFLQRGD